MIRLSVPRLHHPLARGRSDRAALAQAFILGEEKVKHQPNAAFMNRQTQPPRCSKFLVKGWHKPGKPNPAGMVFSLFYTSRRIAPQLRGRRIIAGRSQRAPVNLPIYHRRSCKYALPQQLPVTCRATGCVAFESLINARTPCSSSNFNKPYTGRFPLLMIQVMVPMTPADAKRSSAPQIGIVRHHQRINSRFHKYFWLHDTVVNQARSI